MSADFRRLMVLVTVAFPPVMAEGPRPAPFGPPTPDGRAVSFISANSAVLNYRTTAPAPTRIQVRKGTYPASTPGFEKSWADAKVVEGDAQPALEHSVTLRDLEPATRYFYRIYDPSRPTETAWSADRPWSREHAFATRAAPGRTAFIRAPVKVLIVPNVINLSTVRADAPEPQPMSDADIEMYKQNVRQAALFFWVNSRMRYWLDPEFFIEPTWQREGEAQADLPDFYKGWPAVRDGLRVFDPDDLANHDAGAPLKDKRLWTGQITIICERHWDPGRKRWFYAGSGGGTFGIDWMLWEDATQRPAPGRSTFLGGSDIAWLVCHEFHHQKESQYGFSGLDTEFDRVVFNHFAPRYRAPFDNWQFDTAYNHGEHWDGNAWDLRALTDAQYFRNIFGEIATAKDGDGDGIPDDDPRLPLDEKRLGSDPGRAATDAPLSDMEKVMLARWTPAVLADMRERRYNPGFAAMWRAASGQQAPDSDGAGYGFPRFGTADSDGDGLADPADPQPIYPWQPVIRRASIMPDGDLSDWKAIPPLGHVRAGGVECTLKAAHDHQNLYYAVEIRGPYDSLMFNIDGDADGWYVGNDNLQIVVGQPPQSGERGTDGRARGVEPDRSAPVLRQVIAHVASNRAWPYWDDGSPIQWTDEKTKKEHVWQRTRMFGDERDVVFRAEAEGDVRRIELAIPNGSGKMPIQAGPGHPISLAFYIDVPDGGALSMYEPYALIPASWE